MSSCRRSPPPTPEDILAAQLEQLGEIGSLTSGNGNGSGKGKGNNKKGGGRGSGGGSGGGNIGAAGGAGNDGKLSGASGSEGGVMYCSACGRQYSAGAVEESVARATSSR